MSLVLIFICLQVSGVSPKIFYNYRYYTLGVDASLPCDRLVHYGPNCSKVYWFYYNNLINSPLTLVTKGQVQKSPRSSQFSLNSECALQFHNVSEEDTGLSTYRHLGKTDLDTNVYLSVVTVSPVPIRTRPNQDGLLTLQCTVLRYIDLSCYQDSIRWLDINGAILSGAGVTQNKCESNLTVERHSEHNRTYTCQYVERNTVLTSAHYSPNVKRVTKSDVSSPVSSNICVEAAAVLSLLVLHLFQNNA